MNTTNKTDQKVTEADAATDRAFTLEEIVNTYRRIWVRLPKGVKDNQMGAMKCWSPKDWEVMEAEERLLYPPNS